MGKQKRVGIYARVSTSGQTVDNQLIELRTVAERHGWQVVAEYVDRGISGAKERRPAFDKLKTAIMRREVDLVASWSLDRLGRSMRQLVGFLGDIQAKGVDLYLHQNGVDTTTPGGRALFHMLGIFAEFEREMIRERVLAGLQRARSQGKRLGRPPSVTDAKIKKVRSLGDQGLSLRQIAKETGISHMHVKRLLKAA